MKKNVLLSLLALTALITVAWVSAAESPGEESAPEDERVGDGVGDTVQKLSVGNVGTALNRTLKVRDDDLKEALQIYRRASAFSQKPHCMDDNITRILLWIFDEDFTMPSTENLPGGSRYVDRDNDTNPELLYLQQVRKRVVDSNGNGVPEAGEVTSLRILLVDRNDNGIPERVRIIYRQRLFRDPNEDGKPNYLKIYSFRGTLCDRDENHRPDSISLFQRFGEGYDRNSDGNPEKAALSACHWAWQDTNLDGKADVVQYRGGKVMRQDRNSDGRAELKQLMSAGVSYLDRDSDGNPNNLHVARYMKKIVMRSASSGTPSGLPTPVYRTSVHRQDYRYMDRNANGWPDVIRVKKDTREVTALGGTVRGVLSKGTSYGFRLLRGGNIEYVKRTGFSNITDRNGDRNPEVLDKLSRTITMIYSPRVNTMSSGVLFLRVSLRVLNVTDRNSDGNPELRVVRGYSLVFTDRNLDGNPELISAQARTVSYVDRNSDGRVDKVQGKICVFLYIDRNSDGNPEVVKRYCNVWERNPGGSTPGSRIPKRDRKGTDNGRGGRKGRETDRPPVGGRDDGRTGGK